MGSPLKFAASGNKQQRGGSGGGGSSSIPTDAGPHLQGFGSFGK